MLKQIVTAAVAGLLLTGGLTYAASTPAKDDAKNVDSAKNPVHEVRRVMAEAADAAITSNHAVDDVLKLVNKTDRDRINKDINDKQDANYQKLADEVEKIWKDKYGHKFSAQGHVNELDDINVKFSGAGKNETAVVDFPAEPGMEGYELHLVRQPGNNWWRIQLPDSFNGKNFYGNLSSSLQKLIDEKDKLPGAENKAYERVVSYVLHEMAFPKGAK